MTARDGVVSPQDASSASSDICLACGLCCSGALFDLVPLDADEIARARGLRLPVIQTPHVDGFAVPCPELHDRACAIYTGDATDRRPRMCGVYVCVTLRAFQAGELAFDVALDRVREGAALADELHARVPGWPAVRDVETGELCRPSPEAVAAERDLLGRWRTLKRAFFEP